MNVIPSTVGTLKEKINVTTFGSRGYIQDLIDNASDGDTIYIPSGIYYENIIINKSISLIGEDKNTTIIDGGGSHYVIKIWITDWVNISGFTIKNANEGYWPCAVSIIDCNHTTIMDNIISYCEYSGIYLCECSNIIIKGNKISLNGCGIVLASSSNNTIINNIILNNGCGINLIPFLGGSCNYNTIIDNNISSNNGCGINLVESSSNTIAGNNINTNYEFGISIVSSISNNISFNSFVNGGLKISSDSFQNNIRNNTVNGRPLEYLDGESNRIIDDAGQVILINCNNITIINQNLSNIWIGLELFYTNYCLISGNIIGNNYYGLYLSECNNNTIIDNKITSNNYYGLYLSECNNNTIIDNKITSNNEYGIFLKGEYSFIIGNNISNNGHDSIYLYGNNNTITDNIIISNNGRGIILVGSYGYGNKIKGNNISLNNGGGIILSYSNKNNIENNNIISNDFWGIRLYQSWDNYIEYNNIRNNMHGGVSLDNSHYNCINCNNFINNKENAYNDIDHNYWQYNYWSDYKEKYPDARKIWLKGIWDTPYNITGGNNVDKYPRINQWSKSRTRTITRNMATFNNLLNWFVERFPNVFPLFRHLLKL